MTPQPKPVLLHDSYAEYHTTTTKKKNHVTTYRSKPDMLHGEDLYCMFLSSAEETLCGLSCWVLGSFQITPYCITPSLLSHPDTDTRHKPVKPPPRPPCYKRLSIISSSCLEMSWLAANHQYPMFYLSFGLIPCIETETMMHINNYYRCRSRVTAWSIVHDTFQTPTRMWSSMSAFQKQPHHHPQNPPTRVTSFSTR